MARHTLPRRRPPLLTAAAVGATLAFLASITWVTPEPAAADGMGGGDGSGTNMCVSQPTAEGTDGWGTLRGAELRRDTDGNGGRVVAHQVGNTVTDPEVYLPVQSVTAGERWRLGYLTAADAVAAVGQHQARVEVDWWSAGGQLIGHSDGPWQPVPPHAGDAVPVSAEFVVPAGAAQAHVLAELAALSAPNAWALTECAYQVLARAPSPPPSSARPPTPRPPTTDPEPPASAPAAPPPDPGPQRPPPTADGDTAAATFGWGTPIPDGSDEFNGTSVDEGKWSVYDSAGHAGNGRRTPDNVSVGGGLLTLTGEANGDSAGMSAEFGQQYGRWEARVRSSGSGPGHPYHVLLIIWPDSNQRVPHGEYDFLENGAPGQQCAEAWLHYPGETPKVQEHAEETGCGDPMSEWHNVALEWSPEALVGFIDGREFYRFGAADITGMPSGHLTIQLDAFRPSGLQPATYDIDWVRTYRMAAA